MVRDLTVRPNGPWQLAHYAHVSRAKGSTVRGNVRFCHVPHNDSSGLVTRHIDHVTILVTCLISSFNQNRFCNRFRHLCDAPSPCVTARPTKTGG